MTSRRTIIDGLHRCLCPQYFSLLSSRSNGSIAALITARESPLSLPIRSFSSSLRHQSTSQLTSKPTPEPEPTPQNAKHDNQALIQPPIRVRRVGAELLDMSIPPRRIAYERYHGGTPITYRPAEGAYSGVNKVADLASRSIFPGVFYAAEKLIRTEGYVPDVKLYGALIEACANFPGCLLQPLAFKLLDEMKERGLTPGPAIYCNLLRLLGSSPDYLKRSEILAEMKQGWYTFSSEDWQSIISGYIADGHLEMALEIIEKRTKSGQVLHRNTYRDIIEALCVVGEVDEALRIVRDLEAGVTWSTPPSLAYHLLVAATRELHLEATLFFWRKIIDKDMFNPDDGLCLATLNVAARYGQPQLATDVFRVLGNRELQFEEHHYAALLESYSVAGDLVAAFSVLSVMRNAGVAPTENTARPIFVKLSKADDFAIQNAFKILQKMRRIGKPVDIAALNTIIAVYIARSNPNIASADLGGGLDNASADSDVASANPGPNADLGDTSAGSGTASVDSGIVNADSDASADLGDASANSNAASVDLDDADADADADLDPASAAFVAAFGIYNTMPDFGLRPETSTFNLLLKGAANRADKVFAMNMVSEMKEVGVAPDVDTYEWIFNTCLGQEDYEDAFVFLEEMKGLGMQPRIRMYRALALRCYMVKDARYEVALKEMMDRGVRVERFLQWLKMGAQVEV